MKKTIDLRIPDIGEVSDVAVIELAVRVGDDVAKNDTILVLESDKATVDMPAAASGTVSEILVAVGDTVSQGDLVVRLAQRQSDASALECPAPVAADQEVTTHPDSSDIAVSSDKESNGMVYASPSIRKFARELGVDLRDVNGSRANGRIVRQDVTGHVRQALQSASRGGMEFLPWPEVDFEKFGPVSRRKLSRIARISGPSLARNAVMIPHVTNFESADITDLEDLRKQLNTQGGLKVTILAFVVKAVVAALGEYPEFNSSLDGDELVIREYYNIGMATATPDGLVVPVIRHTDQKSLKDIALQIKSLAARAQDGTLEPEDMQGGTFTISSLGGIGGDNFTPIINAPEVAIVGMVGSSVRPVWNGSRFEARLIQPLSLGWDHRVVDGVAAARFLKSVKAVLEDFPAGL